MRTKCPKQLECLPGKEDHQYAPRLELKPHQKNVCQSLENSLTWPKCEGHLRPKCSCEEFLCLKRSVKDYKTCKFFAISKVGMLNLDLKNPWKCQILIQKP